MSRYSGSDQNTLSLERFRIDRRQAVLLESALGVHCALLITGGCILFASHLRPALFSFAGGALAGLGGIAVHYRHIYRNERAIAWRSFSALTFCYILSLAGIGLSWDDARGDVLMPRIEVAPRSLVDFAPGERTGVGMTFHGSGAASVYSVTSDVSVAILPFPLPPSFPMPPESKAPASQVSLAPGETISGFGSLAKPITMEQILAILNGREARLYVGGTLRYRLASGQQCVRHFLFQTGGRALVASIEAFGRDHRTAPPWWPGTRFNDVSKACE